MPKPQYAEELEVKIGEVRQEVKEMDTRINGHFREAAEFRGRSESLLATNSQAISELTKAISGLSAKIDTLSNFRAATLVVGAIGLAMLVTTVVGAFKVNGSLSSLETTVENQKESIKGIQQSFEEFKKTAVTSTDINKLNSGLEKQADLIAKITPRQTRFKDEIFRWVINTKSPYKPSSDGASFDFHQPLPRRIDESKAADARVIAYVSPTSLSELAVEPSFQISAELDKSGKFCTLRISPAGMKIEEFLKLFPRGLPVGVAISIPVE